MNPFPTEKRQHIPLLVLVAALLNLHHFLAGSHLPATLASFLSICLVLAVYGALYSALFWSASLLSLRLPVAMVLIYSLMALGRGPERWAMLFDGDPFAVILALAACALILILAMSSTVLDGLMRQRLPRNLLWPFALFCAAYVFIALTLMHDSHWILIVGVHLPAAAAIAFFLFLSDRLHVPSALNWLGLSVAILLVVMGLGPHIPLEPPPMEGKGQNFLLITVEGLRHDAITPSTMPNMAAMAREGYLFTGMYGVSPAVPANLNALFVREREGASIALPQLFPQRFSRRALLPDEEGSGAPDDPAGFAKVVVQGRRSFPERMMRAWIPVALFVSEDRRPTEEEVAAECRLLLEGTSRPFVFWLHVDFPARALSSDTVAGVRAGGRFEAAELRTHYEKALRRTDTALGGLFRWVGSRPWSDKTNVLLLGVSGMELGDHGSAGSGHAFYDETVRFPFIWVGPAVSRGSAPTAMSIQDVFPTLVKAFSLADKPKAFAGMDISSAFRGVFPADRNFPLAGNEAYLPGRAVVAGGFKLIQTPGGGFRLYDLAADPRERTDLACADAARAEQMKGLLP